MTLKHLPILIVVVCCLAGCVDNTRQQQLEQREQILAKKEVEFAERAAEYQSLLQMRDSLRAKKNDSVIIQSWPESIAGNWNGKTFCRESNCTDYVVGDQRSDTWAFENDSTRIFTKIINKDKLLRIYTADVDSTEVRLHYKSDSAATRKVDIRVVLTPSGNNLIKGTQTISVNNNCTAKFSVELVRASNP